MSKEGREECICRMIMHAYDRREDAERELESFRGAGDKRPYEIYKQYDPYLEKEYWYLARLIPMKKPISSVKKTSNPMKLTVELYDPKTGQVVLRKFFTSSREFGKFRKDFKEGRWRGLDWRIA